MGHPGVSTGYSHNEKSIQGFNDCTNKNGTASNDFASNHSIAHIIDAWRETMTMMITAKRNRKSFARCRVLNPQGMWRPNLKQMS